MPGVAPLVVLLMGLLPTTRSLYTAAHPFCGRFWCGRFCVVAPSWHLPVPSSAASLVPPTAHDPMTPFLS